MTTITNHDPQMKDYLKRLRWSLSHLPEEDRKEIIEETKVHFLETLSTQQQTFEKIASEFGTPEEYAQQFIQNYEITRVVASGSAWQMISHFSTMLGQGIKVFVFFVLVLLLYGIALTLSLVAILKPLFPEHVGLWTSNQTSLFALGYIDNYQLPDRTEHLGYWVTPLCIVVATFIYWVTTRLLHRYLFSLRSQLSRSTKRCG